MKIYKNGWTMAELVVAMLVLAILMTLSIQNIKPKKIKVLPFAYASVKNLNEAARAVLSDNLVKNLPDTAVDAPVENSNKTCVDMAETLSLVGGYNCVKTSATSPANGKGKTGKPNFQTSNMISYSGLEKDFTPTFRGTASNIGQCATVAVGMKDVMVDIDGDEGDNKVGKDQFPLKLLQTGEVVPGTCSDISPGGTPGECSGFTFDNPTFAKHPSCGGVNTKFINENYPFAYTVYRVRKVTEEEIDSGEYRADDRITEILRIDDEGMVEISFAKADCIARNNVLTRTQCESLGYKPVSECTDNGAFCVVRQSRPLSMNIFALPY